MTDLKTVFKFLILKMPKGFVITGTITMSFVASSVQTFFFVTQINRLIPQEKIVRVVVFQNKTRVPF